MIIFACDVLDVRLSSAHSKLNQCYHGSLSAIMFNKDRLGLKYQGRDSGEKEKHILTKNTTKRGMCVYILL